jgi:hypothetical protein
MIIGDLNSYTFEDPIDVLVGGGYQNLVRASGGLGAYSYVFNGEAGYLDHALASPALASRVTGATEWHINADEPIALDYNDNFKSANHVNTLYAPDAYRSSDHDPVIVGIDLRSTPASLCALVREVTTDQDVAQSLCDKLVAAAASLARGNERAYRNQLTAFAHQVEAQRGKAISDDDATLLLDAMGSL